MKDLEIQQELRLFALEHNLKNLGDKIKAVDKERHEKTIKDLKDEIKKAKEKRIDKIN